ncbi:LysR substrate-binding domain-containing protein [Variovorax sp. RA8]|uniref:LysR substrate-binding domain-containing protein n=1 Tax=Variovorax sp. (strain JCM 16519 / RA8) TaxID=662548 RepID=UPI001316CD18|nr:LysR substrate-binding domain-containing protein [Variovorax sp. RA8]VTU31416.1 D-malate degradation protein R [Variovorax sp. RA8]
MERSDLELVLSVRHAGSLAGAAAALSVVPSVVTKRLAQLEKELGHRLFERTTRRLSLTAEGEAVCAHAQRLLEGFAALESELRERQKEPSGALRIAATFGFGRRWLGPALAQFGQQYPALQIELHLTERLPDLGADGYDGAVWLWSAPARHAGDWVARRLARNQRVLAASPAYLRRRGTPEDAQALAGHDCLVVHENEAAPARPSDVWALSDAKNRTSTRVQVRGPLSSNSGELVRDWCLAGHGIVLRSLWDIAPQLSSGELVRVLPELSMPDADIQWIAPWRARTPRRVRLLVDFLAEQFRPEPWKPAALPLGARHHKV